jgi:hypothetical protein
MPSVEIITECIDKPILHARCEPACAKFFALSYDVALTAEQNILAFLAAAKEQGWSIGLLGNLCTFHLAQALERQKRMAEQTSGLVN